MNKLLPVLLLLLFTQSILAQSVFEPATYKDNDGNIIEGFIKNQDWRSNPTEFDFKSSLENSNFVTLTISEVIEFEIIGYGKFVRSTVEVDRSTEDKTKLSRSTSPEFNEETLFLKVLIEGNKSLYFYQSGNLVRYFFNPNNSELKQLVYRLYQNNTSIVTDNTYKNQLRNSFICSNLSSTDFQELEYDRKELTKLFNKYFDCMDTPKIVYTYSRDYKRFRISLKGGVSFSTIEIRRRSLAATTGSLNNELGFSFSIETELKLPFNNGQWSLILDPGFERFKGKDKIDNNTSAINTNIEIDYKSLEFPFGLRYYIITKPNFGINLTPSVGYDIPLGSFFKITNSQQIELNPSPFFQISIGLKVRDKFLLESEWKAPKNVLSSNQLWNSDFSSITMKIGYSF